MKCALCGKEPVKRIAVDRDSLNGNIYGPIVVADLCVSHSAEYNRVKGSFALYEFINRIKIVGKEKGRLS